MTDSHLRKKRIHILLALLALSVCAFLLRDSLMRSVGTLVRLSNGGYSVQGRLAQYGPVVRKRLAQDFQRADCPYPPAGLLLVALKQEKLLEVWVRPETDKDYVLLKVYPIQGLCGGLGPKLVEGDGQVPEGIYLIDWLNPNSHYHLSMHIDYPNEYDKARAVEDGRENLGGDIMIHGGSASAGCLAMGDETAEDLFVLAAETGLANVEVILCPFDFQVHDLPAKTDQQPGWVMELYRIIKQRLLEVTQPVAEEAM